MQPWLVYDVRLLREILRFWPGRVLGPIAAIAAVVIAGLSLQSQRIWQAAPPPLQDLVLTATPIPIRTPMRIHDAPAITVTKGDLVGPESFTELAQIWMAGAPTRIALRAPEIVIGGPAHATEVIQGFRSNGVSIIDVTDATIRLSMAAGRELRLEGARARMEFRPGGALSVLDGTARYAGRQIVFALDADLASTGTHDHLIRLSLASRGLKVDLNATLTAGGLALDDGWLQVAADDISDIAAWLGLSFDGLGHGPFRAEGALSAAEGLISLEEAVVSIAGNRGQGSLRLQTTPGRPLIDATLAFATLDLGERPRSLAAGLVEPTGGLARKSSGSAAKLIDSVDADLRISADVIRMGDLVTGHGAISATWRNDGLTVQLAGLDLYGGGASGQLDLQPRMDDPRAQLALKLDNVDLRRLLSALGLEAPIDANSHVAVALTAAGRSWREARDRLTGEVAVRATERAVTRGGLERAVEAAMGKDGASRLGGRAVDGLDWKIAIEGGIMTRQSLAFGVDGIRYGAGVASSEDEAVQAVTVEARSVHGP